MPNIRQPRSGSLQYWPRKRAKRNGVRIRAKPKLKDLGLSGFSGYKVGMTQVVALETSKHSHKKGENLSIPVTVLECPPLKIAAVNLYKNEGTALKLKNQIILQKKDKELAQKIKLPKKLLDISKLNPEEYDDIRLLVYTQPMLTGIGKKKPDIFELTLGGSVKDKISYVIENKEKEIYLESVFNEGDLIDVKSITKGKGFQGPVKRFGISIRQAKSEKSIRNPGSLGPWRGQGHIMWRVAHAGKMGYHQRTEYNKQILKIMDGKDINPKGGFVKYGLVKNKTLLVEGSIPGARKRHIVFQKPIRPKKIGMPTIQEVIRK